MFCGECGAKNKKGAAFCEECGAKLETEEKEKKEKEAETKEVKSEYITSDTKKEGLHYPYYVGLSIFSGITMLIGTGITIGTAINEDLYFERSEYKGAKEKLKINKKMMKIFIIFVIFLKLHVQKEIVNYLCIM